MSDSLRDQLLGLGFKPAPADKSARPARPPHGRDGARGKPGTQAQPQRGGGQARDGAGDRAGKGGPANRGERRPQGRSGDGAGKHGSGAQGSGKPGSGKPRSREEMDLAKAYALRAEREKRERIEAERVKQEEARLRREAKARLAELVKDKALNDKDADIARHFPYGGKIKRIYVNPDQLRRLNAGELGVLQLDGRYLLVEAALLAEAEAVFAPAVALKVDPNAPAEDDPYADPQYQVPDDLVW